MRVGGRGGELPRRPVRGRPVPGVGAGARSPRAASSPARSSRSATASTDLAVGQRVFGSVMVRRASPRRCVGRRPSSLTPVPDGVELRAAAGFGVAYGTAYHSLRSVGRVQPGEWVAVLGAAGGVGLAAVDVAAALGRPGGRRRVDRGEAGGVPRPRRRGRHRPGRRRARRAAGGHRRRRRRRDHRPGRRTARRAGAPGRPVGRAVRHGGLRLGRDPPHPAQPRAAQGRRPSSASRCARSGSTPPRRRRATGASSWSCSPPGRLHPHIGARFPLDDTAAALRHVADRKAIGKVIIEP